MVERVAAGGANCTQLKRSAAPAAAVRRCTRSDIRPCFIGRQQSECTQGGRSVSNRAFQTTRRHGPGQFVPGASSYRERADCLWCDTSRTGEGRVDGKCDETNCN